MSDEQKETDFLRTYKSFGIKFGKAFDGKNCPAVCPFTGKKDKFVVAMDTGLWQAFSAGKSGNVYTFMAEYYNHCLEDTVVQDFMLLASNRKLPINAFLGQMAYNRLNETFMIPMRNYDKSIINITHYFPGKTPKRTAGLSVSLYGKEKLKNPDKSIPIYICEGEWDMFALEWILCGLELPHIIVSVPGASIFKETWVSYFAGRKVLCCYDNDAAGQQGESKVAPLLRAVAKEVTFINWPDIYPEKYDVRDFINQYIGKLFFKSKAQTAWNTLKSFVSLKTRFEKANPKQDNQEEMPRDFEIPSREIVEGVFKKWLKMDDMKPLAVMFGTCFANKIDGDPVWMFLVAPPGGMKTAILMSLNKAKLIETTTSLTPAALISGFKFQEGNDPSLLVKIDGKVLVVKDFTTILDSNNMQRDEIFGILRDAYDGYVEKYFGHIGKKSYKSKFGILAGVTPAVDAFMGHSSSLGERFLKYRLNKTMSSDYEKMVMMRAIGHIEHDKQMKEELQDIAYKFLEKELPSPLPEISEQDMRDIINIAQFTAKMRGSVMRDKYTQDMMSVPVTEIGTRLAKQYTKLAIGICVYFDKPAMDNDVLKILKEIAIDTCPAMVSGLVYEVWKETKNDPYVTVGQEWLSLVTKFSQATVSRLLNDLIPLGIIVRVKGEHRVLSQYRLSEKLEIYIKDSGVFDVDKPPPMPPPPKDDRDGFGKPPKKFHFNKSRFKEE